MNVKKVVILMQIILACLVWAIVWNVQAVISVMIAMKVTGSIKQIKNVRKFATKDFWIM